MNAILRFGLLSSLVAGLSLVAMGQAAPARQPKQKRHDASITASLDCGDCHTPEGWSQLHDGQPGGGFNHDITGFPLRGRHDDTACTQCHMADVTVSRACNSCHEDFHQGFLSQDCAQCHDTHSFHNTSGIEAHRLTRLPLTGVHALLDCSECHLRSNDRTFGPLPADCFACHIDDYRSSAIHPLHEGTADGSTAPFDRNCALCHRASGWSPAVVQVRALTELLSPKAPPEHEMRFPLQSGSHRGATCLDCHSQPDGRGTLQCTGCHAHSERELQAQHVTVQPSTTARACLSCHPGGAAR